MNRRPSRRPDPDLFNYDAPENQCFCYKGSTAGINSVAAAAPAASSSSEDEEDFFGEDSFFDFGSDDVIDDYQVNVPTTPPTEPEDDGKCHGNGIFAVAPCKFGAPLILSWPHFLDADADHDFLKHLEGISPDLNKHGMSMDVQKDMGIALAGNVRLQISVKAEKARIFFVHHTRMDYSNTALLLKDSAK